MVTRWKTVPVAHAPKRAVFALLRTLFSRNSERSQEWERGTQECVRYDTPQAHGHSIEDANGTDSLTVAAR
jgi:hypothetical protein